MTARQTKTPSAISEAGVIYGFDPSDTNKVNAAKVTADGKLMIDGSAGGGGGADRELVVSTYTVKTAFSGASVGDTITATQVIDVSSTPTTVSTLWRNQTTGLDLGSAPNAANLTLVGSQALTDAQLRASPVNVSQTNPDLFNITQAKILYTNSVNNNTSVQLASKTTFTGAWEDCFNQPATQILAISDQPMEYTVEQAIDSSGTKIVSTTVFTRGSNIPLSENIQLNANYVRIKAKNKGLVATTTFGLNTTFGLLNPLPSALSNYSNLAVAARETQNFSRKLRDAFQTFPNSNWPQYSVASGDIIQIDGNAAGASYLTLSLNPLSEGTTSFVESDAVYAMPIDMSLCVHTSQRTVGQEATISFISDEDQTAIPSDVAISSISQSTTTLTVNTATPHNLKVGMRIGIYGVTDSRFNYPAIVVATTPTSTQFTVTAGPFGTLPSVTAGPFTSGYVTVRPAMNWSPNGTSLIFENAVLTNGTFYVKSEGGDSMPIGGTLAGNHAVSTASSASVQAVNAALNYTFRPTTEYRLALIADRAQWSDVPVDSIGQTTSRANVTQVVPNPDKMYKLRFEVANRKGVTRPIAQIVSSTKSGTTTATVVTDVPHGLTTGDYINIYGNRDQTNFANLTTATAVASVVNSTTFTIAYGAAFTGVTYGGYVSRVNGGQAQQGAITQSIQNVSRQSNIVFITASASLTGFSIGDYVNFVGVRSSTDGSSIGIDGAYRVRDLTGVTAAFEPIGNTPVGADIGSTNCGGGIVKRTDLRITSVRLFDFERLRVEPLARPTNDLASTFPVSIQGGSVQISSGTVTTLTGGAAAEDAATTSSPHIVGGVVRTAAAPATLVAGDAARHTMTAAGALTIALGAPVASAEVASAARTTTGNSGTISVPTGGSISGLIVVTSVSGTTPTMDITMEESMDNGTTWRLAWSAPRFTTTGNIEIPAMKVIGLRRWVWTITGTSPSFTFAINTNQLTCDAPIVRCLIDRSIAPNTNGSASAILNIEGCSVLSLGVSTGAGATTNPTYQVWVSDDGSSWYGVAPSLSSTVGPSAGSFISVNNIASKFARIQINGAGVAATHNYAVLRALSR